MKILMQVDAHVDVAEEPEPEQELKEDIKSRKLIFDFLLLIIRGKHNAYKQRFKVFKQR